MLETVNPAVPVNRYAYDRMTADQLRGALRQLDLSERRFAKIYGVPWERVKRWLNGEDIPHSVPVMLGLLTLPGGLELAERYTDSVAHDVRTDGGRDG